MQGFVHLQQERQQITRVELRGASDMVKNSHQYGKVVANTAIPIIVSSDPQIKGTALGPFRACRGLRSRASEFSESAIRFTSLPDGMELENLILTGFGSGVRAIYRADMRCLL